MPEKLDDWELAAMQAIVAEKARVDAMMAVWSQMITARRGIKGQVNVQPDGTIVPVEEPTP